MNASEIFEQRRLKERRSLRRFLLYAGAGSLLLHGWLLGQSVQLPQGSLKATEEDAIELTVVEEPEVKLPEEKPPEEPKIQPEPIVETPIEPPETPVAVAPPTAIVPTTEKPTPDPPAKSLNDALDKPESKITNDDTAVAKGKPSITPGALDGIINGNPKSTGNTNDFTKRIQGILRGTGQTPAVVPAAPVTPSVPVEPPTPRKRQKLRCIENCKAKYPDSLQGKNIQGDPKVTFDVDPNGNVSNVRIRKSSGNAELDAAAIEQAKKMRVSPSEAGRKNVSGTVDFQIEGSDYQRQAQERKRQRESEQAAREQEEIRAIPAAASTNTPTANPAARPVEAPAAKLDAPAPQPAAERIPEVIAPAPVSAPVSSPPAPTLEAAPPPPDPVYEAPAPVAPPPEPVYEAPPPPPPEPAPVAPDPTPAAP
jgi:TonB family protein